MRREECGREDPKRREEGSREGGGDNCLLGGKKSEGSRKLVLDGSKKVQTHGDVHNSHDMQVLYNDLDDVGSGLKGGVVGNSHIHGSYGASVSGEEVYGVVCGETCVGLVLWE